MLQKRRAFVKICFTQEAIIGAWPVRKLHHETTVNECRKLLQVLSFSQRILSF